MPQARNIGEVLFNALSGGARAFGRASEQKQQQTREDKQQTFLNRLRTEAAGREEERLGISKTSSARQDKQFKLNEQKTLFDAMQQLTGGVSPLDQSLIDQRDARTDLLEGQLGQLGQAGNGQKVPASTFNDIFGQLSLGYQGREFGRQVEAENPAFGTAIPAESNFFSADTPARFEPSQNITPDQIPIPPDTLTALLQQARQITGGEVPRALGTRDAQAISWAEQNISDWQSLSPQRKQQIIDKVNSGGF